MCDVAIIGEPNFRLRGQQAKDVGTRDAGWQRVVDPGDQLPQKDVDEGVLVVSSEIGGKG